MENHLYRDIKERTGGEIYIGVVGPVRTGKSTFIKRFMDMLVLPHMEDPHERDRATDELPQSAAGKTIMTTEPKFVPKDAVGIQIADGIAVKIRLIDCVGYMVEGAAGHLENNTERMVKTPWYDEEIPFTRAAELGTYKVIHDHSTIGIVVTCDGSFGEIPAENYRQPEERTVEELKKLGKPFVILLNTTRPYSDQVRKQAEELYHKYSVPVIPVNCEQLKKEDITMILEQVLLEFPLVEVEFHMPRWVEMLSTDHPVKQELIEKVRSMMDQFRVLRDIGSVSTDCSGPSIHRMKLDQVALNKGTASYSVEMEESCYYEMLTELTGMELKDEYDLISTCPATDENIEFYRSVGNEIKTVKINGKDFIDGVGIPIGNYFSQYDGNFFLSGFDHWIKETKRVKHYYRYMDDICIFAKTKEELHQLLAEINEYFIQNLKLRIKGNYQIFPSFIRGIDFVGYRIIFEQYPVEKIHLSGNEAEDDQDKEES